MNGSAATNELAALSARVREHIPLTRHLAFELLHFAEGELRLMAPLAPNINDKGTLFAGSQAALMALAGWCLTTLLAEQALVARADVVAVDSQLRFRRPLMSDLHLSVRADAAQIEAFGAQLAAEGRADLHVSAIACDDQGRQASRYQGRYQARAL